MADYKTSYNKTPSHNSRVQTKKTVKPEMSKPPGEESNPYYKTQPRNEHAYENENKHSAVWKNMTQEDIISKDMLKLSGISPASVKNGTSKYMKFSLGREAKVNPQLLELPDGLKDISGSDLEVEDFESPSAQKYSKFCSKFRYNDFSIEDPKPA